jgi:hypothetical protein
MTKHKRRKSDASGHSEEARDGHFEGAVYPRLSANSAHSAIKPSGALPRGVMSCTESADSSERHGDNVSMNGTPSTLPIPRPSYCANTNRIRIMEEFTSNENPMRGVRSLHCALLLAAACVSARNNPPPRLAGTYNARLVVTGRSTYVGSFTGEWSADSLRGALKIVSPLTVDMPVRGAQTGDSLRLRGSYSASNGCTGTIDASVAVAKDLGSARGPFTLADRCAGTLTGTMELTR